MAVSKLLTELIFPLNQLLFLLCAGLFLSWRGRRKLAVTSFLLATAILMVASIPFFANPAISWLETYYPALPINDYPRCDAIVVLGGSVYPTRPPRPEAEELGEARLLRAIRLYKAGKADIVIASAGPRSSGENEVPEADDMREVLIACGVPSESILVETKSRNTAENATETARLLSERGGHSILLVTSAIHLRRATALFEKAGLEVIPVPSSFRVVDESHDVGYFMPNALTLRHSSLVWKEYVGHLAYELLGWL